MVFILRQTAAKTQVLLMERADSLVGAWCQVAGSLEQSEAAWQAALREVLEETGLVPDKLYSGDICEQFYEPERECISIFPIFVAYVAADCEVVLNEEHSAYRWLSFDEARELVSFSGQRRSLLEIENEFVKRSPSPHLEIPIPT
jgi:dATP pyrophosphohydrolase|tara:strand:- start:321 stop:755 length:435 start_codon:yes stop_codon:yes gene_type:complete